MKFIKKINQFLIHFIYFLALVYFFSGSSLFAQKDDTLYFLNNDRISGEIKQYKYGYLNYKTYGVSTVSVKYEKISTFYSSKNFEILFKDGRRQFGSFDTSQMAQHVKIISLNDTLLTPIIEIVEIVPIKNKFWTRLSGNVDLGFSYTKANTLSQLTFSSGINYRHRNYFSNLNLYSLNSVQDNQENSRTIKNDVKLTIYRRIKGNWWGVGTGSSEQSTELGLDLRLQGGAGISNEVIHTNSNNLLLTMGAVSSKEWSADTTLIRINIDAYGGLQYRLFRFKDPELSITTNAIVYPSLNVANRWRLNYDIKFNFKIISDMYISFSFYYNFDSRPPSETSSNTDYSFTSTFGYSF